MSISTENITKQNVLLINNYFLTTEITETKWLRVLGKIAITSLKWEQIAQFTMYR